MPGVFANVCTKQLLLVMLCEKLSKNIDSESLMKQKVGLICWNTNLQGFP